MTQEDKELLLKDLCARTLYGVICLNKVTKEVYKLCYVTSYNEISLDDRTAVFYSPDDIIPYLRPMDSMTEEERKELSKLCDFVICCCDNDDFGHLGIEILTDLYDKDDYYVNKTIDVRAIDWLLSHHFDYQDLIDKELALVAPKDMYV